MDNNALVLCQCYLGTGRLAVLERWSHYRGGQQCFSALSVLFGDREVGCFRETVTFGFGGERWRDGEDNRGRVMGEGEEGRWRGREGREEREGKMDYLPRRESNV